MAKEIEKYVPGVKYPIVKASFDVEATRLNYQVVLQSVSGIQITKDNVNDDITKDARNALKALEDEKDRQSVEPRKWHSDIMEAYKSLKEPLQEAVNRVLSDKKTVALKIQEETQQQLAEQNRINNAKSAIVTFTNKIAGQIAEAKTDDDIVSIEKAIGSEKTKKNLYQEFLPDLITQCDGLRPQIKDQKENIRKLQKIVAEEQKAIESGDVVALTEIKEQKEHIEAVIQETGIRIHETAFEQATTIDIVAPEVADTAPKGRTNWKWRVDDIKLLQKKMPHLVKLVPDEEAIAILLKTKKSDGSLDGKMEETLFGLTFFNDKSFSR